MSSSNETIKQNSYIVVPRGEYEKLYNRQYTELTMLKKKIDPDRERESYLGMTSKTDYPKVYTDMIKNDYIITNAQRTKKYLDKMPKGD